MSKGIAPLIIVALIVVASLGAVGGMYYMSEQNSVTQNYNVGTFGHASADISLSELIIPNGNYTINGTSVYIDDNNLFLSANPHTLYQSGDVTFELISKTYQGSADIIFGFDYPTTVPLNAKYYNPTTTVVENSYTCNSPDWFNYTATDFWCWRNMPVNESSNQSYQLIFSHKYNRANLTLKTAYWNVNTTSEWQDISGSFQSINYNYGGMTKWYYKTFNVVKDKSYIMKSYIQLPFDDGNARKYWVCIKPSSETISQASANGHLYCLDPWYQSTLFGYRYRIYQTGSSINDTYSVNDTNGVGLSRDIMWSFMWNDSYVYSAGAGTTLNKTIANETVEKWWENETTLNGNNVAGVYNGYRPTTQAAIAVYHFGNTSGSVMYDSMRNYDSVTWINAPTWTTGVFTNATLFDKVATQVINISTGALLASNVGNNGTVEFWFQSTAGYAAGAAANEVIFSKRNSGGTGFSIELANAVSAGSLRARFDGSNYHTTTTKWNAGQWYHVAVRWSDNTGRQIYVNGTQEYTTATNDKWGAAADTYDVSLGAMIDAADRSIVQPFGGKVDELRIYNYTLSNEEIQNHYFNGIGNRTSLGTEETPSEIEDTNESYATNVYEALATGYNISIRTASASTVTAKFSWNGTQTSVTGYNNTPINWHFNTSKISGLVVNNATAVANFWNFSVTPIGGAAVEELSTGGSQDIYYNPFLATPTTNNSNPVSGEGIRLSSTYSEQGNVTVYNVTGNYNSTIFTPSGAYYFDTTANFVPINTVINYKFGMTVAYSGRILYRETSASTLTISPILLLANGTGIGTLNFSYFKEESPYTPINASHNLAITIWKSNSSMNQTFNFTLPKGINHTISLWPVTADVYAFSIQEYWNSLDVDNITYPQRNYYLNGLHLTNTTQNIYLYLLNSSYADVIGMSVLDRDGIGIDDVIIDAQRYYPGENIFRTVARGYTDSVGDAAIRLFKCTGESSVYHKFMLYKYYTLIGSEEQSCIIEDTKAFHINEGSAVDWWNIYDDVNGHCTFHNTTQLLICDYASTKGDSYNAELYVKQIQINSFTQKCNTTTSGSSGSITCDLSGMINEQYFYWFKVYNSQDKDRLISSGAIKNIADGNFGQMGLLIAFMMFVALAFIGWQNPLIMMLLSIIGVIAGFALGFYEVTISGIASLVVAGAIIMWGVR